MPSSIMTWPDRIGFISEFVRRPLSLGAIAPSSQTLAQIMVDSVDWANTGAVLEYGPGTGVFTQSIQSRMTPGTQFVAIEMNSRFVRNIHLQANAR